MSETKVAVITGASRGLGLALAKEFAAHDWQVVGTGRSPRPADLPEDAAYHQFDASDTAACETFWKQVGETHADAQICLINNAGGYVSGSFTETKPGDYTQMIQSGYFAAVYMTRGLAQTYPSARVINVISASALKPSKTNSAYGAAKAAEMHFFQSLQQEFKPEKCQITNLYPSDIATQGPNPNAIQPEDLAVFIREQAENQTTYYLRDAILYSR